MAQPRRRPHRLEGRAPVGEDIDSIVDEAVGRIAPGDVADEAPPPAVGDTVHLRLLDAHTCFYRDEQLVENMA